MALQMEQQDAFAFVEFATQVRLFAPALGASPEQQAPLIRDTEVPKEATSVEQPEPARTGAAYLRAQEALGAITTTPVGLTMLAQHGQEAYQAVFGG
jgi:hypothetical protein